MKIPKTFNLKGKRWRVVFEPNLEADGYDCDGLCVPDKRIIYIDSELNKKKQYETFLHELFHAVVHEAHIPAGGEWNDSIEDVVCDAFKDVVLTMFADKEPRRKPKK
jgi:Zn-dependent peptidase ImmA (M78 family)